MRKNFQLVFDSSANSKIPRTVAWGIFLVIKLSSLKILKPSAKSFVDCEYTVPLKYDFISADDFVIYWLV